MKKDFFKPLDFIYDDDLKFTANTAANLANEKLNKLIESWPVVYGNNFISNDGSAFDIGSVWNITKLNDKTHTARLAFIEEIKKECVKHEPFNDSCVPNHFHCKHCGVELQATWSEKK